MKKLCLAGIVAAMAIAAFVGIAALSIPTANAYICECAPLDAPVKCKGGKIYPNLCVANCARATQCVPYGNGGPI